MSAATAARRSSFIPARLDPGIPVGPTLDLRFDVAVPGVGQYGGVIGFRLFGIRVRVHPTFLLVAVLLGLSTRSAVLVAAWVGIVFVSILVHELGHALTARSFGASVEIELNGIGGLTSWSGAEERFGPGRRALVAAAGSAVGVLFGGLIWVVANLTGPFTGVGRFVIENLIFVNVFWGLLNWLPIRPLDGGHLLTALLQKATPANAERVANVVFMITAVGALAAALWFRQFFIAILAGWLVMAEFSRGRPRPAPVAIPPMSFDRADPDETSPAGVEEPRPEPEPEQADG